MNKKIKRALDGMKGEARHLEDLQWLADEGDELIRLHRKLKSNHPLTREDRSFLMDVVFFALGASLRAEDEVVAQDN
jgi:hypothetical protein